MNFLFPSLISGSLIIIGWIVIYNNAKKMASRSETKAIIDLIVSKIDALTTFSTNYWLSINKISIESKEYELMTLNQISQICGLMNLLPKRGLAISYGDISYLSECATLNCEKLSKMTFPDKQVKAHQLNTASILSIENLYKLFHSKYEPSP